MKDFRDFPFVQTKLHLWEISFSIHSSHLFFTPKPQFRHYIIYTHTHARARTNTRITSRATARFITELFLSEKKSRIRCKIDRHDIVAVYVPARIRITSHLYATSISMSMLSFVAHVYIHMIIYLAISVYFILKLVTVRLSAVILIMTTKGEPKDSPVVCSHLCFRQNMKK